MTRTEFDAGFTPMTKALGVKVTPTQADYFWDEFQHQDHRDFAHACRELAMGNPGYLPKLVFFRDNILAAKEMRLEGEKVTREEETTQFWCGGTLTDAEYGHGKAALAKIKKMLAVKVGSEG